jgi:hypothetical protein
VPRATERVCEHAELSIAADELGARLVCDVDPEARVGGEGFPHPNRLGFAFGLDGGRVVVVDDLTGCPIGRLVDEDPVDRSSILETCGCVDDVARGHSLARLGASVQPDERLSRRDGDPHLDIVLLDRPLTNRKAGANGTLGIVLVGCRRAEERHDRVADELLDGAAVALELGAKALVIRAEERFDVFGIESFSAARKADEVAEDDRDDLALSALGGGHRQALFARSRSPRSIKRVAPTER